MCRNNQGEALSCEVRLSSRGALFVCTENKALWTCANSSREAIYENFGNRRTRARHHFIITDCRNIWLHRPELRKEKGYGEGICFAAGFALGIIGLIIVLLLPDKNADAPSKLDDLLKYKQLFDSGAITQEEFEAKKKELL